MFVEVFIITAYTIGQKFLKSNILMILNKSLLLNEAYIYLVQSTAKTVKLWNIFYI